MHHLLNNGAEVNQRDEKGMTPLHRAAFLAQYDGYLELYEYLLVSRRRLYVPKQAPRSPADRTPMQLAEHKAHGWWWQHFHLRACSLHALAISNGLRPGTRFFWPVKPRSSLPGVDRPIMSVHQNCCRAAARTRQCGQRTMTRT